MPVGDAVAGIPPDAVPDPIGIVIDAVGVGACGVRGPHDALGVADLEAGDPALGVFLVEARGDHLRYRVAVGVRLLVVPPDLAVDFRCRAAAVADRLLEIVARVERADLFFIRGDRAVSDLNVSKCADAMAFTGLVRVAAMNSRQPGYRSPGCLASTRANTRSIAGGRSGRSCVGLAGASSRCAYMMAASMSFSNG